MSIHHNNIFKVIFNECVMAFERKIDVYPFGYENEIRIVSTGKTLETNSELTAYIEETWKPKSEKGWKSSWIHIVTKINESRMINSPSDKLRFNIEAGAMTYAQTHGCLEAIKQGKPFAPKAINNLSIGIIPITKDGYVILSRRNPKLDHAGGVWNFNGGYMTSLLIDKANCDNLDFINDLRLFDINEQLKRRIHRQEFYGLNEDDLDIGIGPNSLAFGFYHSLEMELGWVVIFNKTKNEMQEHIRYYEFQGQKEHTETTYLTIEDLEELLLNQGDLLNENPRTYNSKDPKKLILLDDNIGELIGGSYSQIKKEFYESYKMDRKFVEPLKRKGLEINLKTNYHYEFPTSF